MQAQLAKSEEILALYKCQFPSFETVELYTMLPLGEAELRVHLTPLYIFLQLPTNPQLCKKKKKKIKAIIVCVFYIVPS